MDKNTKPDTLEAALGLAIRQLRLKRELALEEVADRASLSATSVRSLELGRGSSLSTLIKVLEAIDETAFLEQWIDAQNAPSPIEALRQSQNLPARRQRAPKRSYYYQNHQQ
ncbi:hypothetical protein FACS1894104_0070 [Actinomycetota bacterium]|nr:hypothetical protein FACS1894104_0070 [Actinomycetota bacterium]